MVEDIGIGNLAVFVEVLLWNLYSRWISPRNACEIKAVGSTFGIHFRVTTFGESHGGGVGCIVDGCPPRLPFSEADLELDLERRYLASSPYS
ncbi:hypothetical protein NL676_037288 [Syzygium grande]|nr:hypothetical protein NL676_037288 [Syzygium grande]